MRRVVWTSEAFAELRLIRTYIATFNPTAADRLYRRLFETGNSLSEMPLRGRSIGSGVRQIAAVRPYLIRYVVTDTEVAIISIRHSAREPDRTP